MTARGTLLFWMFLLTAVGVCPDRVWAQPEGHRRMKAVLASIRDHAATTSPYLGTLQLSLPRQRLAALPADAPVTTRVPLMLAVSEAQLHLGHEREAVAEAEAALALLTADDTPADPTHAALSTRLYRHLAVAWLRIGETENCCARAGAESCLLPLRGEALHAKPEGSRKAVDYLLKLLARMRPGSGGFHEAAWLLNLAHMTLGQWPAAVPEPYRLPADSFKADQPFPRFVNRAAELGLDRVSLAGGAVADDLDGDGDIDLLVSSAHPAVAPVLYRNTGKGRFVAEDAGLEGIFGGLNMVAADYDNDGDVDVLVLRGAWQHSFGRRPNSLLQNQGDGRFVDVGFESGLAEERRPTQAAAWADFDLDGDLDLFVGNETTGRERHPCNLYRNNGDGTFTDIAAAAGVALQAWCKAVAWGDVDGDRYPDLYVSVYRGPNHLYRNLGDGRFEDVTARYGVAEPIDSFPTWFWDADNDGRLDLFVGAYLAGAADMDLAYRGLAPRPGSLAVSYLNDGQGFRATTPIARPFAPMGCNVGDLDADGFLDIYLGTGWPNYEALMPNVALRNTDGTHFADVTFAAGLGHLQKGHAVAMADFDEDGDLDIFQQMGGFYPGDTFGDCYYEHPGHGKHWLAVDLEGVHSNRDALGARIKLVVKGPNGPRTLYRFVGTGASFGGNPRRSFFGLGDADSIESLTVYWPTGDTVQTVPPPRPDRRIHIREAVTP